MTICPSPCIVTFFADPSWQYACCSPPLSNTSHTMLPLGEWNIE